MFGWLYKGIAKAVIDEASVYVNETMSDEQFQKNITIVIDQMVDRQKQRVYGQIGAVVRDNPEMNPIQQIQPPNFTNKDGSFNWAKLIMNAATNTNPNRAQPRDRSNRKVMKYQ